MILQIDSSETIKSKKLTYDEAQEEEEEEKIICQPALSMFLPVLL